MYWTRSVFAVRTPLSLRTSISAARLKSALPRMSHPGRTCRALRKEISTATGALLLTSETTSSSWFSTCLDASRNNSLASFESPSDRKLNREAVEERGPDKRAQPLCSDQLTLCLGQPDKVNLHGEGPAVLSPGDDVSLENPAGRGQHGLVHFRNSCDQTKVTPVFGVKEMETERLFSPVLIF